jgi:hypothetical protein
MNYGELKKAVSEFANRTEANIDTLVALAHASICTEFEPPDSLALAKLSNPMPVYGSVYSWELPDDIQRVREVLADGRGLTNTYLADLFMLSGSRPERYAVDGINLLVAPGQGIEVTVRLQKRLPDLVADNDTNWLLSHHPQLYLHGTLVQLHQAVQDEQQVSISQTLYDQAAAVAGQQIQQLKQGGQLMIRSA